MTTTNEIADDDAIGIANAAMERGIHRARGIISIVAPLIQGDPLVAIEVAFASLLAANHCMEQCGGFGEAARVLNIYLKRVARETAGEPDVRLRVAASALD